MQTLGHHSIDPFTIFFVLSQLLYTITFVVDGYILSLPIDRVDMDEEIVEPENEWPFIVLFYPVLRELEDTMRTTFRSLANIQYPPERRRVIAIPNSNDLETIESLKRLATEFDFLDVLSVPSTTDPSWNVVWEAWQVNSKAYWWHQGKRAGTRALPPKKTRQLIYAFYTVAKRMAHEKSLVINYIDADSCPPRDHFRAAVIGLKHYDVLQAKNVAGNLNASMPAAWHAFDHMSWDGNKYAHFSAHGRQPYWVLGKGLFFRASDLTELGGFHPWITIEDPEVGMRFWANGKRIGIIEGSLVEEVPESWREGVTQRKRWVCGFFQSLGKPLVYMGLTPWQRFKCWLIFLPCLSLWVNALGVPLGIWALVAALTHQGMLPRWTIWLGALNLAAFTLSMISQYAHIWHRTKLVLDTIGARMAYMLRINPISVMIWWVLWLVPLAIGFRMYLLDEGLVWERTRKVNANESLVTNQLERTGTVSSPRNVGETGTGAVALQNEESTK